METTYLVGGHLYRPGDRVEVYSIFRGIWAPATVVEAPAPPGWVPIIPGAGWRQLVEDVDVTSSGQSQTHRDAEDKQVRLMAAHEIRPA